MKICNNCQHPNPPKANFCGSCGKKIETNADKFDYNKPIKKIAFLFFTLLAYIVFISLVDLGQDYYQALINDGVFALITLVFYFLHCKEINKLIRIPKLKPKILITILYAAPLFAFVIIYLAEFLNQSIFNTSQTAYYETFKNSPAPITLTIISIGLFPAVFEELAFRGFIFNQLLKITGVKATIIISSILFTILHLSVISIFWIFPLGIVFGYFRARYRTIWYGIFGHFVYNSSIVIIEIISK